jgi:hypothetical protein
MNLRPARAISAASRTADFLGSQGATALQSISLAVRNGYCGKAITD